MKIVFAIIVLLLHYTSSGAERVMAVDPEMKPAAFQQLFAESMPGNEGEDDISALWQQKNPGMKLRAWRSQSQLPATITDHKRQYRILHSATVSMMPAVMLPHLKLLLFPNHYFW